jgi:heme/copper-type cytochrome/quinol oxidase subunit 2
MQIVKLDKKGEFAMGGMIGSVILLVVAVILVANVVIPTVKGANTTNYTSSELALWGLITLAAIIGTFVLAFRSFGVL